MARPKPDNYERMQIVLGDKERTLLEDYRFAYMFNQIATPTVNLLKDVSGLAAVYLILSSIFPNWSKGIDFNVTDAYGDDDNGLLDYLSGISLAGGIAGAAGLGYRTRSIYGVGIGFLLGLLGGEGVENIGEQQQENLEQGTQEAGVRFTLFMLKLRNAYIQFTN